MELSGTGQVRFGADAGGTRTQLVISGPDGAERTVIYPSLNPAACGPETARHVLRDLLGFVRERAGDTPVSGWLASASVCQETAGEQLGLIEAAAGAAELRGSLMISGDVTPLLLAPPLSGQGSVVVVGTGSCVLAGDGVRIRQAGGHEYLGSDEASAFDLGMAGLRAACRALDGVDRPTALAAGLEARLGADPRAAARRLALQAFPKQRVAALAPAVCAAWTDGDQVARAIVAAAVTRLAETAAALRQAADTPAAAGSVLTGGALTGCPPLAAALAEALRRHCGEHRVTLIPDASAAALRLAAQQPPAQLAAGRCWQLEVTRG